MALILGSLLGTTRPWRRSTTLPLQ
jgi:hypothetical protein